ncbi:hypothetical protein NtRootA4_25360 [Arthrobacter sp. NtRootA4]|nr:hypothetical protein NtRootA2_27550 [Arthrobacter sp. NtRootA2]BCW15557.1 hypothetical protein NtRootA4_25360 [Arthrobacter sp. NtRootA4]BCW23892.1 hypothetical protein NtRootC7_27590 [Arthrobacter sp. NtRootC7]BCW28160.1 hypothetical protein NtRootC45_27600 [Arthrobacter sp. NtRootC45]BCW32430.1 hypothetical protein NtRootD5_27610 [Arthrobacter sp. NtRootD5]GGV21346.1 hypothetical protein GCM10010212_02950 [Paenarthrobacter nicotinovorans]
MRNTVAGGHDVQLAGPHHNVAPDAVTVPHGTFQWPGDCLQTTVGVGKDAHRHPVRAEAVQEAPGPYGGQSTLRQRPHDVHRADAAQGDFAFGPQLNAWTLPFGCGRANFLCRGSIKIGHVFITCA